MNTFPEEYLYIYIHILPYSLSPNKAARLCVGCPYLEGQGGLVSRLEYP